MLCMLFYGVDVFSIVLHGRKKFKYRKTFFTLLKYVKFNVNPRNHC